jgi:hypothetical protein
LKGANKGEKLPALLASNCEDQVLECTLLLLCWCCSAAAAALLLLLLPAELAAHTLPLTMHLLV